jgi:hypothetical protein
MLQNLPFVISIAVLSYLFVMWIYTFTFSGVQRIMFFVFGTIGLSFLYSFLAAGYFKTTYTQESWEIAVVIGLVVVLMILGPVVVSKVGILIMVSRIRSHQIGNVGRDRTC